MKQEHFRNATWDLQRFRFLGYGVSKTRGELGGIGEASLECLRKNPQCTRLRGGTRTSYAVNRQMLALPTRFMLESERSVDGCSR